MNEETFTKELAKYKVVRRADHHKEKKRTPVPVVKAAVPTSTTSSGPARVSPRVATGGGESGSFWALMESTVAKSGVLTQAETDLFVGRLKKEQEMVHRQLNLDDLNAICKQ